MNLTPEQIQSNADAVIAWLEGKDIESKNTGPLTGSDWKPCVHGKNIPTWDFDCGLYRPKPEPKTRLWNQRQDIPSPVCWLRFNHCDLFRMITGMSLFGIATSSGEIPWAELSNYTYSVDLLDWHKCETTMP